MDVCVSCPLGFLVSPACLLAGLPSLLYTHAARVHSPTLPVFAAARELVYCAARPNSINFFALLPSARALDLHCYTPWAGALGQVCLQAHWVSSQVRRRRLHVGLGPHPLRYLTLLLTRFALAIAQVVSLL